MVGGMSNAPAAEAAPRHLTSLLVWAVVFCDIGTSVYIVGIVSLGEAQALLPWRLLSWASVTAAPCTTFCAATS